VIQLMSYITPNFYVLVQKEGSVDGIGRSMVCCIAHHNDMSVYEDTSVYENTSVFITFPTGNYLDDVATKIESNCGFPQCAGSQCKSISFQAKAFLSYG